MLDVCLLGTAGMMPLPNRWLTSCLFRFNGEGLLIDCGEGTQVALREAGFSPYPISIICITHYHADHVSGLPGLLLSMGNSDRTDPITIVGPKGLERVVNSLRIIAPELPFEIRFHELTSDEEHFEILGYQLHAFKVNHNVLCYGYTVSIPRKGRFDVEMAQKLGLPVQLWNPLQKGNNVEFEGKLYTPDMVMGQARKGLKVTYCTDTRPTKSLVLAAADSDLLICEGMYAEEDKLSKAKQNKHMTFYEAAKVAKDAAVKELWLTHFSPSMTGHKRYMKAVREIFPAAYLGEDGKFLELDFSEE
ncbi:MAG: ribonuclease Z [Pseudobutyrivibrio ruminis]|nr:ribonuclease Z [Pseudobutyrivibrio ruminis]